MASGADIAIAVGTVAAATLAGIGLIISLYINSKDRKRADHQARDDRQAAVDLAVSDRAAIREDAQRRHIVDLLLALGREVAKHEAYSTMPQGGEAAQQVTLLLNALPAECAHTVRQKFHVNRTMKLPGAVGLKMGHLGSNAAGATSTDMLREIAFDIDRYLNCGLPPDSAWDDWDGLAGWMKERWPS